MYHIVYASSILLLLLLPSPPPISQLCSSECAYYFSLSWLITWFSHVVHSQQHAARLVDFFLASHPIMSVYLSAAVSGRREESTTVCVCLHPPSPQIIISRRSEVLSQECEMSAVHGLLTKLPQELDFEVAISTACELFQKHPPSVVAARRRLKLNSR